MSQHLLLRIISDNHTNASLLFEHQGTLPDTLKIAQTLIDLQKHQPNFIDELLTNYDVQVLTKEEADVKSNRGVTTVTWYVDNCSFDMSDLVSVYPTVDRFKRDALAYWEDTPNLHSVSVAEFIKELPNLPKRFSWDNVRPSQLPLLSRLLSASDQHQFFLAQHGRFFEYAV